jgi:hypothetical protein
MDLGWLKTMAPLIGTALGGPLGGAAAAFMADKLGIENKTIEAVTDLLDSGTLTPEQITNVKLAELDFRRFLEANKIDLAKLDVANTQGARDMQVTVRSWTPDILAILIVSGFFGILVTMLLGILKVSDQQALLILLGSLSAGFGAVLNFFFGSSRSSQNKDVLIANSTLTK